MLSRPRWLWLSTPLTLPRYFTGTFFGSSLKDEDFVTKTINDSNIDLDKFPTSKVRQLAKKMVRCKGNLPGILGRGQVTPRQHKSPLMWHQCTDLPASKHKKKTSFVKPRPPSHKNDANDRQQVPSYHNNNYKNCFDAQKCVQDQGEMPESVESLYTLKVSSVQQRNISVESCHKYKHFTSLCYQKKPASFKPRKPKVHMLQAGAVYSCDKSICSHSEVFHLVMSHFVLQVKIQCTQTECKRIPTPSHLITILAYKLKPHQTRNQYLRTRLDNCTEVNIMPASIYSV